MYMHVHLGDWEDKKIFTTSNPFILSSVQAVVDMAKYGILYTFTIVHSLCVHVLFIDIYCMAYSDVKDKR